MLQALRDEHGLRQQELATRLDRSESWVSRGLDLMRVLPASVQEAVQKGRFSAKAAERVLVPLARAKPAQCEKLVRGLMPQGASARELLRIYEAWKRSTPEQRERIVGAPLFLQAEALVLGGWRREQLVPPTCTAAPARGMRLRWALRLGAFPEFSPLPGHDGARRAAKRKCRSPPIACFREICGDPQDRGELEGIAVTSV